MTRKIFSCHLTFFLGTSFAFDLPHLPHSATLTLPPLPRILPHTITFNHTILLEDSLMSRIPRPPSCRVPHGYISLHAAFFSSPPTPFTCRTPAYGGHVTECLVFPPTTVVLFRDGAPLFFRTVGGTEAPRLRPLSYDRYPRAYPLQFLPSAAPPAPCACSFGFFPPLLPTSTHSHTVIMFLRKFFALCCLPFSVRTIKEPYIGAVCIVESKPLLPGLPYMFVSKHAVADTRLP